MKTSIMAALWVLAFIAALLIAARLVSRQRFILRGHYAQVFARMIVVSLVGLGLQADKASAEFRSVSPGGERGRADPTTEADNARQAREPDPADPVPYRGHVLQRMIQAWCDAFAPAYYVEVPDAPLPRHLTGPASDWLTVAAKALEGRASEEELNQVRSGAQRIFAIPPVVNRMILADLDRLQGRAAPTPDVQQLLVTLDQLEQRTAFNHWLIAYLWRKTAEVEAADLAEAEHLEPLYQRLAHHARITDALTRARSTQGVILVGPRAWMSKAGPSVDFRLTWISLARAFEEAWLTASPGTWYRHGMTGFTLAEGSAPVELIRLGEGKRIEPGERLALGRLDLLDTAAPARLEHPWLGTLELEARRRYTVWHLPGLVRSPEAQAKLDEAIEKALTGDEPATLELEQAIGLTHQAINAVLEDRESAEQPGAAKLRLILSNFQMTPKLPTVERVEAVRQKAHQEPSEEAD
ncbi:MAG: hypothetical protein JJU36_05600 [Phycisphaeraceae bacterium]|nr:hypothetical protein [Phycisphaeraceae bacterium]